MALSRRTFALLLATTPGIGGKYLVRIITRNDLLSRSPEEFLRLSVEALKEEYRLPFRAATNLVKDSKARIRDTEEIEKRLSGLGVLWVTANDAHYPTLVEEMDPNGPGVLFLYGNTKLLDAKTFCVLSSRNSLPADLNLIEKLTEEGVLEGQVLVTGHDKPEYQRSAVVPLRWGSPRILCLDRGLFNVLGPDLKQEAFRAARLWRYEFDPRTDLVACPFKPDAHFVNPNNKVRDRLVGCLARRLDFVQVSEGGNMDAIAKLALKAGRPVRISDRSPLWRRYEALGATRIPTQP